MGNSTGWFQRRRVAPARTQVPPTESPAARRSLGLNGVWADDDDFLVGSMLGRSGVASVRLSVVYGCVSLIASKIASLPMSYWQIDERGQTMERMPLPLWVRMPDPMRGVYGKRWADVVTEIVWSMLLAGNAFLALKRDRSGRIVEVCAVDPGCVTVETVVDGEYVLRVNGQIPDYPVVPIRYIVPPGSPLGMSPIQACHRAFTVAEGAQEQSAGFFARGSTLPGQLIFENEIDEAEVDEVLNTWNRNMAGVGKAHLPLILQGAEYKPIAISPEDAQTLDTWRWSDARIAKQVFHLDPIHVGVKESGTQLTYQNVGQQNRVILEDALLPLMRRIETAFDWMTPNNRQLRFDVADFLAADERTRFHNYQVALKAGFMTVDEVRAKEGLPPMPQDDDDEEPAIDGDDAATAAQTEPAAT